MPTFQGSGLSEEQIENYDEYAFILRSLNCCICLEIVKNPFECSNCESLYCCECWEWMKISGKKCVINCSTPVVKANKFVYNILNKLRIKCNICNKSDISYSKYTLHENVCLLMNKYSVPSEWEKILKTQNEEIEELHKKINDMEENNTLASTYYTVGASYLYTQEELREKLMTFKWNVNLKMQLYSAAVEGRVNDFKNMVLNKGYSVLEEVSATNYFWTPLHYSMHYGQIEITCFILDYLKQNGDLELAMRWQSNDKRCPLLCLLKSNSVAYDLKKQILEQILSKYDFSIPLEVMKEIKNKDMESIVIKYRK